MAGEFNGIEELEVRSYFELVFVTDVRFQITKLVLKGPQIPNLEESPTVEMFMKNGKVVIKSGVGEHLIDPTALPSEMRAFFGGRSIGGKSGPQPVPMPNQNQLRGNNDDYIDYSTYKIKVLTKLIEEKNRSIRDRSSQVYQIRDQWVPLPKPVYDLLVRYYKLRDMRKQGPLFL